MSDSQQGISIQFIDSSGKTQTVNASAGESLMQAAKRNHIDGIDADCGGAASCGTCQIVIPESFRDIVPEVSENEADMLEFAGSEEEGTRLACQILADSELNGMTVRVIGS